MVEWSYFDKFEKVNDLYLPAYGEGETKATQLVTAICKLIYKWYNDGDVFDNTYYLDGWCNDLSSYANWIYNHYKESKPILNRIKDIYLNDEYEELLKDLADIFLKTEFLSKESLKEKEDSIYSEIGTFVFEDENEEE